MRELVAISYAMCSLFSNRSLYTLTARTQRCLLHQLLVISLRTSLVEATMEMPFAQLGEDGRQREVTVCVTNCVISPRLLFIRRTQLPVFPRELSLMKSWYLL